MKSIYQVHYTICTSQPPHSTLYYGAIPGFINLETAHRWIQELKSWDEWILAKETTNHREFYLRFVMNSGLSLKIRIREHELRTPIELTVDLLKGIETYK